MSEAAENPPAQPEVIDTIPEDYLSHTPLGAQRRFNHALYSTMTPKACKLLAMLLLKEALSAKPWAVKEIANRMGGLPAQQIAPTYQVEIPDLVDAASCARAQSIVAQQVASGQIPPKAGEDISKVIENARKAFETENLEQRIAALEQENSRGY